MGDDNGTFELSRRKALAGLGTIGVASAGAGLGTSAFFSDTESFEDNQLTAGELDLAVKAMVYEYQGQANDDGQLYGEEEDLVQNGQTPTINQELEDVKPGDYSYGKFCFSIVDNPAFLWAGGQLTGNAENGQTEPEEDVDSTGGAPGEGNGELADAIEVTLYCVDHDYDITSQGRPSDASFSDVITQGSLRQVLAELQTGIPLDADPDDGEDDRDAFQGSSDQESGFTNDDKCLAFAWELPTDVGNEVQTDSVEFDLAFAAYQERHNDGSQQPFADAVLTSDATGGIRETDNWITATVSAGPTTVINIELDGEVYGGGDSGLGEWPNNENVYFMEANIDIDNDGIDEAANDDDFRVGYAAANSGARAGAISNSGTGASGDGGYIRRNTGDSSSGASANRTDVAEEDVPGFTAYESADQLSYTFVLDWSQIAADSTEDTAELSSAPGAIQINEVFGGDGGEGVGATPNSSNDGRGDIDNVADGPTATLTL